MAIDSVHEWIGAEQGREYTDLEEMSYRAGCELSRNTMVSQLKAIDEELLSRKPSGLRVVGLYDRTMVTRFGDVTISRRLYRDTEGETMFALDERMGWKPKQLASPSIAERMVEMAADMPPYQVRGRLFRKVSETVSALTAGVLSSSTVHRLLTGVGEDALAEERERWEAQFERGEDVCDGQHREDILYTEADGVWIHLQREELNRHEVRSGIAYRGWRQVAGGRYELEGKRVYAHGNESIPFWEGASLEWGKQYAMDAVKLFVVGGDGANWVREGAYELPTAEFQLDGFHLARACGRGYGKKLGRAIYEAIRSGDSRGAHARMKEAAPAETWLSERYSPVRLARFPNSGGISPLNSFAHSDSVLRLVRLPNSGGISPLNWFPHKYSPARLARFPNSGGISPLNSFAHSDSVLRLVRLPNSGGISG